MPIFRASKVVAALPATLTPSTIYAVRTGAGFDLYISDSTGTVAHALNASSGGVMPDGITSLTFASGLLAGVSYPDGSSAALTWSGGVLQSAAVTRAGSTRTRTLTWSGGVLQSVTTVTTP